MRKRVRVVNRKDHTWPRIGEPQQSRHRFRAHFAASHHPDGRTDHLLQFGRVRQWWTNV
jgi:hypothetical protein